MQISGDFICGKVSHLMSLIQPAVLHDDVKVSRWEAGLWVAWRPVFKDGPSFEAPNKTRFLLFGLALLRLCPNSAWFLVKTL